MEYIDINEINIENYYGFIYETTNNINGMKYIGQCKFNRINGWENYLGSGVYFKRAVKKYGEENFTRRIIYLAKTEKELDDKEIYFIELFNTVDSKDYYNVKKTAKGGDTFTNNPHKEQTRLLYKKIRSGKGNSQYGKQKTDKMIKSVKEANSKRIMVNGIVYDSLLDCCEKTGIKHTTLSYRLRSCFKQDYLFLDDNNNPISKEKPKVNKPRKKTKVKAYGIEYNSMRSCMKSLHVNNKKLKEMLDSEEYKEIQYI